MKRVHHPASLISRSSNDQPLLPPFSSLALPQRSEYPSGGAFVSWHQYSGDIKDCCIRPWCPVGCIVSAASSLTECRITQRDATLVCLLSQTLLCLLRAIGKWFFNFWGTDERIITGRLKLVFTFICNNLKSLCRQRSLHSHLSLGWIF